METEGEELSRLRAEVASFRQLLTSKDAQLAKSSVIIASKDQVIACQVELMRKAEEVQRLKCLVPASAGSCAADSIDVSAGTPGGVHDSSCSTVTSPLDSDELLHDIFSYVGGGDHLLCRWCLQKVER
jgi:hypothetical protein